LSDIEGFGTVTLCSLGFVFYLRARYFQGVQVNQSARINTPLLGQMGEHASGELHSQFFRLGYHLNLNKIDDFLQRMFQDFKIIGFEPLYYLFVKGHVGNNDSLNA
jgi:hypothetical protein